MDIQIQVNGQRAKITNRQELYSGTAAITGISFDFSKEWFGMTKTATVYVGAYDRDKAVNILIENDKVAPVQLPSELFEKNCELYVGAFGIDADGRRLTSSIVRQEVKKGIPVQNASDNVSIDVYTRIIQLMTEAKDIAADTNDKIESNKIYVEQATEQAEKSKQYAESAEGHLADVETVADNVSEMQKAIEELKTAAEQSASDASTSELNASQSEQNALASELNAEKSEQNASKSATDASTSASNAKKSETAAATSEQNARKITEQLTEDVSQLKESIVDLSDTKKEEISQKGLEVLQSIPADFSKVSDTTLIKRTTQGTDIQLKDASDMNIQELHLYGKTEQKTTKGIQLLNLKDAKGRTGGGITYTQNGDGTFKRVGTATSNSGNAWLLGDYIAEITDKDVLMILEAGKQYFVKDCAVFMGTTIITAGGGETINVLESKYPEGIKVTGIRNPGVVLNRTYNDIIYPIIAKSSTAIEWEEYTGGQPSPSPDYPQEIKSIENPTVSVAGKNLFEPSTINYSYNNLRITANVDNSQKNSIKIKINTINATEGDLYALAYVDINKFVKKIKSNTTYTIVLKNPQNIGAVFVGTIIGTNRITNTVAVKSNVIKLQTIDDISNKSTFPLVFYFAGTVKENVTIGFDDIAIYEGDYPNAEIEEFKEIQLAQQTCELNGIDDVKDELIVNADGTGKFVQRINKSSLNDKSNFAKWYETTNTYGFEVYDSNCAFYSSKINIIAEKLQGKTIGILNSGAYNTNGIAISTNGKIKIKILKKYLAEYSTDALKKFLKNNTIKILTILPEPTVTDLTAEEVKKILAIHTNKPISTIWNDQNAEMQVTYVADTKKYIDDRFEELSNAILASASEAE